MPKVPDCDATCTEVNMLHKAASGQPARLKRKIEVKNASDYLVQHKPIPTGSSRAKANGFAIVKIGSNSSHEIIVSL
jgi:hypothetical protein